VGVHFSFFKLAINLKFVYKHTPNPIYQNFPRNLGNIFFQKFPPPLRGLFRILNCAQGKRGRQLLGKSGEKTNRLQQKLKFTPWILLDGERIVCAFYALDEYVCDRLDPKPEECENIRKPPS
jgi:hypothetical protein